jgi:hypothetical protein
MEDNLFLESLIRQTALTPKQSVVGEKINEAPAYTMNWNDVDDQIDSGSSDVDAGTIPSNYERGKYSDDSVKLKQAYEKLSQQRQDLLDQIKEIETSMRRIVQMSGG